MNNVFVYCEIEGTQVQEVSQELLTKGRKLANELNVELHAIVAGTGIKGKVEDQILPYGVDKLFVFDAKDLFPYTSAPHTDILVNLFKEEQPQICLMGATVIGRDLGPRVSSSLTSGLTADCTELEIGPFEDKKNNKTYENLLYQIRPAFGGNIVATIVNPDHRPQMATVRSGVMQKALYEGSARNEVVYPEVSKYVSPEAFVVKVLDHHVEAAKHNLKGAPIVVAGGYGMGSKENFDMLFMVWVLRRTSTCCSTWLRCCMVRLVVAVLLLMLAGWTTTVRLVRRVLPFTQRYTLPAVSLDRFSTSLVCRILVSSSLSTAIPMHLSTASPTTSLLVPWRR